MNLRLPTAVFVLMQAIVIGAALAAVGYRYREAARPAPLPPLREKPITVRPLYDDPEYAVVVTDEQLARTLMKLRPRLNGNKTKVNSVDHALRFWGVEARFDDPKFVSGQAMRELLTNRERFLALYGAAGESKPLLIPEGPGVRVRVAEGELSSSHVDHTVASLAEVGTPLDFPISTAKGPATFRAMVEQVLRDFSLNQVEYEWSAMTFAMFLPPANSWQTKEGQEMNFDRIADRIMRQDQPQGVCFGNHRLYSLVVLLRVDDEERILSPEGRERIVKYLEDITARLAKSQHESGFWNNQWPTAKPTNLEPTTADGDRLADRIIATGHALEWWAMVPRDLASRLHPPRNVLAAAGQWVVAAVDKMSDEEVATNFTFLSHAGRSLALWRGKFSYEVELSK
jgi:hypothetical protein